MEKGQETQKDMLLLPQEGLLPPMEHEIEPLERISG